MGNSYSNFQEILIVAKQTHKHRKRILLGQETIIARDIIRQVASEHEVEITSGKVACDYLHLFISYRLEQLISKTDLILKPKN